ncbi:MAG: NAD-dependent epimerase/dehydratase family protein [Phycisphaeraceae bacterium]|nr:NAD-dependent epimerase/dehydratase family protein [Phycisphaeraceae bacterium]
MADGAGERYIITGGGGFIGSNLVATLLSRRPDAALLVVDDFRSGSAINIVEACERRGVPPFGGDLIAEPTGDLDWDDILEAVKPDAVFHLAAITDTTVLDERRMLLDNVEGFRGLLHACVEASCPLVYASSAATYGSPAEGFDRLPFPESAAGKPNNVYGFSKWMMETLHRRLSAEVSKPGAKAPRIVGLRYFNVYGPGEARKGKMASMPYQLAQQILAGKRPRLFTGGEQARDQVHVDDVVAMTLAGANADATPGVYNCGSGRATTFNEIADAVRRGMGVDETRFATEYFEMPPAVREFYQEFTCADLAQAKAGLDWAPQRDPITAIASYAAFLAGSNSR